MGPYNHHLGRKKKKKKKRRKGVFQGDTEEESPNYCHVNFFHYILFFKILLSEVSAAVL